MGDIRTTTLGGIPFGDSSKRPTPPQVGQPYFNGEENRLEVYTQNVGWQNIVAETPSVLSFTGYVRESNTTNTLVIAGTNFAAGCDVKLIGNDATVVDATQVSLNSVVQVTATFPQLNISKEPYDIKVINPSNLYGQLNDVVYVNDKPVWNTASGSLGSYNDNGSAVSIQLSASDEEGSVTYSSADLPSWLTLSSSGLLTGNTPSLTSGSTVYNFNITVTDNGGAGSESSTRAFSITVNWVKTGIDATHAFSNGVEAWDAGLRTSGLYYISTSNGVKQVYVDLQTTDPTTGKAGWMLVGSWSQASRWGIQATTSTQVFGNSPRSCFSANFGTMNANFVRFQVSSSISSTGVNADSADFYHYSSSPAPWRQWWVTNSSNDIVWSTTVNKNQSGTPSDTFREAMRQFTHSYNLKFAYQVGQQWQNLSDGSTAPAQGRQGDWWNGLNGTETAIGWNAAQDGSISILQQGSTSNGCGQDCNEQHTKFGSDDNSAVGATPNVAWFGSSATENMNAQTGFKGSDTNLWMWIK